MSLFAALALNLRKNPPVESIKEQDDVPEESYVSLPSNKIPVPTRTPMGDYIVPPGGKPLTSLGYPCPGPADYSPTVRRTKPTPPQYSIVGKHNDRNAKRGIPGPFEYNCSGDIKWKNKKVSLKGRERNLVDDQAANGNSNLGKYNVEYMNVGQKGPKFKIGTKPKSNGFYGLSNNYFALTDAHGGIDTPGPNYRPNSGYWGRGPKKSFGISLNRDKKNGGPGPGDYETPENNRGPSHSFGMKLPAPVAVQQSVNKFSPAANTYDIGTTIGKAPAISISGRTKGPHEAATRDGGPCPSSYHPRTKLYNRNRAVTLAYKWFENDEPVRPGPTDYKVYHVNLKTSPAFTCRQRTKHTYPESVALDNVDNSIPGPGSYDLVKPFVKNDGAAYSFRQRLKQGDIHPRENFPGPNTYEVEKKEKAGSKRAPKYSMGRRTEPIDHTKSHPGPAEYHPQNKNSGPKYTMTKRPQSHGTFVNPAPNRYTLPGAMSGRDKGLVFKSRTSPYVYSGHRSNRLAEPPHIPLPSLA